MTARVRRGIRATSVGMVCVLGGGVDAGCSTLLGIGDWTNLVDGGQEDSSADVSKQDARKDDASGDESTAGDDGPAADADDTTVGDGGEEVFSEDGASPLPNCAPGGKGLSNCGTGEGESCCTALEVEGGTFYRTYANDGGGPTGEADPATVSTFVLDKYLVTVGRFRQFVSAWRKGYVPSATSGKHTHINDGQGLENGERPGTYETGWDATDWNNATNVDPTSVNLSCGTWTNPIAGNENLPITCVNWYESYAFCIWDGGFLPSEAEWEYAAAGGARRESIRGAQWRLGRRTSMRSTTRIILPTRRRSRRWGRRPRGQDFGVSWTSKAKRSNGTWTGTLHTARAAIARI